MINSAYAGTERSVGWIGLIVPPMLTGIRVRRVEDRAFEEGI